MFKKTCIGILGGGQLARMSAYQAYKLGFDIAILEKEKNSPAGKITHNEFVGWVDNETILKKFIQVSDIITLENEFVDYHYLRFIENLGKEVIPSSYTISLIQDKLLQKQKLRKKKIPVADFIEVNLINTYQYISTYLGKKFVLKSRKMGYDGYGNALVRSKASLENEMKRLTIRHSELYAEKYVNFSKELAIMVVRTKKEIKTYPVVETIQKKHICHTVIAPAQIEEKFINEAEEIAIEAVKAVRGYGIFGIELFLTEDGKILVNEMAPRPHNSGHYTIDACITSQFENHIRSVLNLPLGSTDMVKPYSVMINLLGKKNGEGIVDNYKKALSEDDVNLHIYGKEKSRIGRKMGHITVCGNELQPLLMKAKRMERKTII